MVDLITLTDVDENCTPPEQPVLTLGVVSDTIFISIEKMDETYKKRDYIRDKHIAVRIKDLLDSIHLLSISNESFRVRKGLPK